MHVKGGLSQALVVSTVAAGGTSTMPERFRVVVADYLAEASIERAVLGPLADIVLLQETRESQVVARTPDADAIIAFHDIQLTEASLSKLPHCKVVAIESITVPAGTFQCYRIEANSSQGGRQDSTQRSWVRWYCPEVKWMAKEIVETIVFSRSNPSANGTTVVQRTGSFDPTIRDILASSITTAPSRTGTREP
jgi:ribosomal protein S28E/S33